jgi:hypothetical protein
MAREKVRATFLEDERALECVERLWIEEGSKLQPVVPANYVVTLQCSLGQQK